MQTKTHNKVSEYLVQIIIANNLHINYYKSDIRLINRVILTMRPQRGSCYYFHSMKKTDAQRVQNGQRCTEMGKWSWDSKPKTFRERKKVYI